MTEITTDLPHRSHDGEFLRVDEALEHDADRHVDVILIYIISQVKSRVRFRHANHRLDVTHCDWDASGRLSTNLVNFNYNKKAFQKDAYQPLLDTTIW